MVDVVAGIIWKDDKVLIARRGRNKHLAGKWEFPGGKVESGESIEQALERELKEEFGICTITKNYFDINIHHYSTISIKLYAYYSIYVSGNIEPVDHDMTAWVDVHSLIEYDFAEADIPFVHKLKIEHYHKPHKT